MSDEHFYYSWEVSQSSGAYEQVRNFELLIKNQAILYDKLNKILELLKEDKIEGEK